MARRRLTAIAGALGLVAWLVSSGVTAQADTPDPDAAFNTMVGTYTFLAGFGHSFCYAKPANETPTCPANGITQTSTSVNNRDNVAVCVESTNSNAADQSCSITQTNVARNNIAIVIQIVNHKTGATQNATQTGTIKQDNLSGNNFAAVLQFVRQSTETDGPQSQTSNQSATIEQNQSFTSAAASGRNLTILGESSNQFGESETGSLQTQFSDQDVTDFPHHINQHSSGVSKAFAGQAQLQRLVGSGTQTMTVDPKCCSVQDVNLNNVFKINQFTSQVGNPNAVQDAESIGTCNSTGQCTITQSMQNNKASTSNTKTCTGPCSNAIVCTSNVETGTCGPPDTSVIFGRSGRRVGLLT